MRGAALWVAYAPRTIARICPASSVAAFCWIFVLRMSDGSAFDTLRIACV